MVSIKEKTIKDICSFLDITIEVVLKKITESPKYNLLKNNQYLVKCLNIQTCRQNMTEQDKNYPLKQSPEV